MTPKALTQMQGVELIQDHMKQIAPFLVVNAFIKMKLRPLRTSTVDMMRACLAIYDYRLPITTRLIGSVLGADESSVGTRLHNLGDKKCLLLKRSDIKKRGHRLEWTIDPLFLANYK
jgi:hypothetical protein